MGSQQPDFTTFGKDIIALLDARGWNNIPKRELFLQLVSIAIRTNVISQYDDTYAMARRLRLSPAIVRTMHRDMELLVSETQPLNDALFFEWARASNRTTADDEQKGLACFSVQNSSEEFKVEEYLQQLGITADRKLNKQLIVIDIRQLIKSLAQKTNLPVTQFLLEYSREIEGQKEFFDELKGSEEDMLDLLIKATREQAEKKLGANTFNLMVALVRTTRKALAKSK